MLYEYVDTPDGEPYMKEITDETPDYTRVFATISRLKRFVKWLRAPIGLEAPTFYTSVICYLHKDCCKCPLNSKNPPTCLLMQPTVYVMAARKFDPNSREFSKFKPKVRTTEEYSHVKEHFDELAAAVEYLISELAKNEGLMPQSQKDAVGKRLLEWTVPVERAVY